MWAGFAAYLGVLATAPALGGRVVWGLIAVLLAGFAVAPVLLSHDVYSYVAYARLGVRHGLDPYVRPPDAAPADAVYPHVTWIGARSAYGPLFTLLSYPLAWLPVGLAVAALKALAALAVLATAVLVARIAAWRGVDPLRAAAFVALNPLVLVHVVGGAHNDALTTLLATLSVAALLSARHASGGASLIAAIATKASAAFLAPFTLAATLPMWSSFLSDRSGTLNHQAVAGRVRDRDRDRGAFNRLLVGAAAAASVVALGAYLAFGWAWLAGFGLAGENQNRTSHLSLPTTAARITGLPPGATRLAAAILFAALVIYLLAWVARGGDWVRAAAWSAFGLLLATAWLLPWYLLWPLPLVAVARDRPLQLLVLALTAYQLAARIPL